MAMIIVIAVSHRAIGQRSANLWQRKLLTTMS
jgi:hypothetical protein